VGREVPQQQLDQAVVHVQPGQVGRLDDGAAHLRAGHRDHHDLALLEGAGQLRVPQRTIVEVGPQGEHHDGGPGQRADGRDKAMLVHLVPAGREYFL
jgi:hypothetical protein